MALSGSKPDDSQGDEQRLTEGPTEHSPHPVAAAPELNDPFGGGPPTTRAQTGNSPASCGRWVPSSRHILKAALIRFKKQRRPRTDVVRDRHRIGPPPVRTSSAVTIETGSKSLISITFLRVG
jgi:hypothetical protein